MHPCSIVGVASWRLCKNKKRVTKQEIQAPNFLLKKWGMLVESYELDTLAFNDYEQTMSSPFSPAKRETLREPFPRHGRGCWREVRSLIGSIRIALFNDNDISRASDP